MSSRVSQQNSGNTSNDNGTVCTADTTTTSRAAVLYSTCEPSFNQGTWEIRAQPPIPPRFRCSSNTHQTTSLRESSSGTARGGPPTCAPGPCQPAYESFFCPLHITIGVLCLSILCLASRWTSIRTKRRSRNVPTQVQLAVSAWLPASHFLGPANITDNTCLHV